MQRRLPDVEIQRSILTKRRDEYLAIAFNADAEAEGLAVQEPTSTEPDAWKGEQQKQEALTNLRAFSTNCRKSADKMDELIAKLPASPLLTTSPFLQ